MWLVSIVLPITYAFDNVDAPRLSFEAFQTQLKLTLAGKLEFCSTVHVYFSVSYLIRIA